MKNVTISMDEDTLAWVRVRAAEAGMSVSRWMATFFEDERRRQREQDDALDQLLAIPCSTLNL